MRLFILRKFFNTGSLADAFSESVATHLRATVPDTIIKLGFEAGIMVSTACSLIEQSKSISETENILRNLTANLKGQV